MSAAETKPPRELCPPTEGPVRAYCGQRAIDRKSTKGQTRHAVGLWARLAVREEMRVDGHTGKEYLVRLFETECGADGLVEIGPWNPEEWDPKAAPACRICAQFVAGTRPMPRDPKPAVVPVPAPVEREEVAVPLAA